MRVLLDEQIPVDLAVALPDHNVSTVVGRGWTGISNGELLRRMQGEYDAFVTMDRGIEFQQNLATHFPQVAPEISAPMRQAFRRGLISRFVIRSETASIWATILAS